MSKSEKKPFVRKHEIGNKFIDLVKSGASFLYLNSNDEQFTLKDLRRCIASMNLQDNVEEERKRTYGYYEWSESRGIIQGELKETDNEDEQFINLIDGKKVTQHYVMAPKTEVERSDDIMAALTFLGEPSPKSKKHQFNCQVIIMKDLHHAFRHPKVLRKIKDIIINNDAEDVYMRKCLVVLSAVQKIPTELENLTTVIDWKLPNREEIFHHLSQYSITEIVEKVDKNKKKDPTRPWRVQYTPLEKEHILNSLTGLSIPEIDNIVTLSQIKFDEIRPEFLIEQKKQMIMKNGLLEYHDTDTLIDDIGGMDLIKEWITLRKKAFTPEATKFGIRMPKGVLMVGIQGCGKSAMAKAIAAVLQVPLIRFDVGKVFAKTVGSSEENVRNVLNLIEAVSPCVVMIDEIEKGLAGVQSSNASDGGTTARVVGTLLSWMQDNESSAFIVATANNIRQLPPELQRKGRIDEIFFVPLPEESERDEIFQIHIRKTGRDPKDYKTGQFAKISEYFSGAECEHVIQVALISAFDEGKELEDTHIVRAITDLIPLYHTCEEDLKYLYKWVGWNKEKKDGVRARFASSARKKLAGKKGSNEIIFSDEKKEKK